MLARDSTSPKWKKAFFPIFGTFCATLVLMSVCHTLATYTMASVSNLLVSHIVELQEVGVASMRVRVNNSACHNNCSFILTL